MTKAYACQWDRCPTLVKVKALSAFDLEINEQERVVI